MPRTQSMKETRKIYLVQPNATLSGGGGITPDF
jgi:hypothetical protein